MRHLINEILEESRRRQTGHVSSCITALPLIVNIFDRMRPQDRFVLSAGHAALALYVVLKDRGLIDTYDGMGTHPKRDRAIDCSTGSLGQGVTVALGMAMASPEKDVYVLLSDGECAEGSVWEALTIRKKFRLDNLKVFVNANGWSAYDPVDVEDLDVRLRFLTGVGGHYLVLK
jgi:transketolase